MTRKQTLTPSPRLAALLAGVAMAALASAAHAQSMDYGALQQVFGEPVTTSATGKPQRTSEVPVDMEIITQDDIRRSGADNIPDILAQVAGIDFRRSSANDAEVAIRGYNQPWNPRLLVLLNGRPVYENWYGDVVWSEIPVQLSEIRQIEVVKGPNSALFGFNAASGVINIVTVDPLHDKLAAGNVNIGSQSVVAGSVVAALPVGDHAGLRISLGDQTQKEYPQGNLPSQNLIGLLKPESKNASIDARWQIAPNVEVRAEASSVEMQRNFPADATPERDVAGSLRAGVSADTQFGLIDLDAYRNIWKIAYEGGQPESGKNIDNDIKLSDLFKINPSNSLRLAAEYKSNTAQGQFLAGSTISYQIASASAMWDWEITPKLSLNNAVRVDHMQLHFDGAILPEVGVTRSEYDGANLTAYSFNSGLVYRPEDADTLRLTFSRGLQLPSLNDLAQQINAGGGVYLAGDPQLRPTAVTNVELGWDRKFEALKTTVRLAVFGQLNQQLFGYDASAPITIGPNTIYQSVNIGSSREAGVELSLKGVTPQQIRWSASYAYAAIHDHIDSDIAPGVYTAYANSTPADTVKFSLGRDFGRWELDTHGRWETTYTDYQFENGAYAAVTIKPYLTMDARAGYRLTDHITLSATVDQLNQQYVYERASTPVERRVIFSASARF